MSLLLLLAGGQGVAAPPPPVITGGGGSGGGLAPRHIPERSPRELEDEELALIATLSLL